MTPVQLVGRLLFLLLVGLGGRTVHAQSYDLSAGLRLGTEWGLSVQMRMPPIHKNFALEAIAQSSFQREETQLTLLGKQHYPILTRRLNLFFGGGLHKGWITPAEGQPDVQNPFGVTGIGGAEITLGRINLSYDFKPALNLSGGEQRIYSQSALSVRYVLSKRNDIFDKAGERDRNKRRRQKAREKRRRSGDGRWWEVWKQ